MRVFFVWSLLAGLVVIGCSTSGVGSGYDDREALEEIQDRILELQEDAAVNRVEVERLRQQVASLEAAIRLPRGESSILEPTESLTLGASGGSDVIAIGPPSDAEVETSDLAPMQVVPPSASEPPPAPASQDPNSFSGSGGEIGYRPVEPAAQALYDRGYTLFHQGRYLDAEAAFQRFLHAYSDTDLSDNAQFWIGECRYARDDLRGALAAFRETIENYPEGNKIPDAMLKEADCLRGLGDLEGAGIRYEEVIRRFPGTAAATGAQERRQGTG